MGYAFAALIGAAVPTIVFGRAVFAVVLGIAFFALVISGLRCQAWRELRERSRTPVGIAAIVTITAWVMSSFGSEFPWRSFEASARTGFFVSIGVMVSGALKGEPRLRDVCFRAFIIVGASSALLALVEMTIAPELFWALRLKGWLAQPLHTELKSFSSLAVIVVPSIILAGWILRRYWMSLAVACSAAFLFLVWENHNRAAIAGFLAIIGILAAFRLLRPGGHRSAVTLVGFFIFGSLSVAVWLKATRPPIELDADWVFPLWLVDFQRQTIWGQALEIWQKAPWFGVGANTINFDLSASRPLPGDESLHIIPAHPHNWIVEILAETGVIGLASLLVALLLLSLQLARRYRTMAVMAGYWVSGLFNFSVWSAWWQASFVLTLAVAFSAEDSSAATR
jgi:O-antigen ligase